MTDTTTTRTTAWEELQAKAEEWFFEPDLEAFRVVLSAITAHYDPEIEPCWLFIVGASSTGKTALAINSLMTLKDTHSIGDLSTKTFLSSYAGNHSSGLLSRVGDSSIFLFKDFTTFLSKRADDRATIAAQLREIYDGQWHRETGAGKTLAWEGKCSIIAACTPALERAWAIHRDLGERFITIRWHSPDEEGMARRAMKQRGYEGKAKRELQRLTKSFVEQSLEVATPKHLSNNAEEALIALSRFVTALRGQVIRDSGHRHDILDIAPLEGPARLIKVMDTLCRAHACLFGRSTVTKADLEIARRVAFDTIPPPRLKIIQSLPSNDAAGETDLLRATSMHHITLKRQLEELEAIGVISCDRNGIEPSFSINPKIKTLLRQITQI